MFDLHRLVTTAESFKNQYLSWSAWQKWCIDIIKRVKKTHPDVSDEPEGESPAIEVLKFRDPKGYFAGKTHMQIKQTFLL